MKGLIVAAGQGVRLRAKGDLKPLIPIKGVPLIECVIDRARSGGIDEFFVVSGYRGDELRAALNSLAARENIRITHVINRDWNRANGHSVLMAKQFLDEPFVLMMCDHLVDPEIIPQPDRRAACARHRDARSRLQPGQPAERPR